LKTSTKIATVLLAVACAGILMDVGKHPPETAPIDRPKPSEPLPLPYAHDEEARSPKPQYHTIDAPVMERMNFDKMTLRVHVSAGSAVINEITIYNTNTQPVRDIVVACLFYGASGTPISEAETTIYDKVAGTDPNSGKAGVRTFRGIPLGTVNPQVARLRCILWSART